MGAEKRMKDKANSPEAVESEKQRNKRMEKEKQIWKKKKNRYKKL
tara:strand:+ start:24 stop:158 length:135 start_codon:yes stop_codon:yes gene_type:complete